MRSPYYRFALVIFSLLMGCNEGPATTAPAALPHDPEASLAADAWVGRWTGPEGTYIDIAKAQDRFVLTIQSLDGQARFDARWQGDRLEFLRGGEVTTLRATDGVGTGMKWLQDKRRCLTIRPGEGFCRD